MYTREELKLLKREFWNGFAEYCEAQPYLAGRKKIWMLYNTKVKGVELKFDANRVGAYVILEVNCKPVAKRREMYEKLGWYKDDLQKNLTDTLIWAEDFVRESGEVVSRVYLEQPGLDIHRRNHWPAFYEFMATRMYHLEKNLLRITPYIREE
jgi:hypothetical protein